MKRSRIFLAISAGLLAVAGVAVAKSTKISGPGYFLTQDQKLKCVAFQALCTRVPQVAKTCVTVIKKHNGTPVSTIAYTNTLCTHPLHYTIK
jgi:hypothetical protein